MRAHRWLLLAGILLANARVARGQSLAECLAVARANAPALMAAGADVQRAEQAIREARAALIPALTLSANFLQYSERPQQVIRIPGAPVSGAVPTGQTRQLELRTAAQWTLFSGGRNRALVDAAQAGHAGQLSDRDQTESDVVLRVSQSFYRAIAAERLEAAAAEAVVSAQSHLGESAARVRAGVGARVDSLRAAVDVLQRDAALLRAQEAGRIARTDLEAAMGSALDSTRALVAPGPPPAEIPALAPAVEQALLRRSDVVALDQQTAATELRTKAARAERWPQVNLSATAAYVGANLDGDYLNFDDPGLKTYRLWAALNMSLPLLDGGRTGAQVGQLTAERAALLARRRDVELQIRREVEHALSDMRVALAVWPGDRSRVEASREALRLAEAGYKGGTSTATDVRDAASALADARAAEAETLMDYWIASAALDHAIGVPSQRGN